MQNFQFILALVVTAGLGFLLFRKLSTSHQQALAMPTLLFRDIIPLLNDAKTEAGPTAGSWKLTGKYQGHFFQLQTVVDALVTRKVPSLWLMVTLPEPQPVEAVFNLMMRAGGPSTFSNFDFLEHVVATPSDFPEHAMIRTDDPEKVLPSHKVRPHLQMFFGPKAKELLVSPKGLRIVVQAAQADRARYSVLREANFGDVAIDADLAKACLETLLALRKNLRTVDA